MKNISTSFTYSLLINKLLKKSTRVSVIIPVRNEQDNLPALIRRLTNTFINYHVDYELIAVDDYSTDKSYYTLLSLGKDHPLKVFKKTGPIGRGASILEGIGHASCEIIAVIDADLAYPPEIIPNLIDKLSVADIIVGDRVYVNGERFIKKITELLFRFLFGRILFGSNFDVQSGLKVFKREIIEKFKLNPSKWSFDLEFLMKAANAGYKITGLPIPYESRKKGTDKMNIFYAAVELMLFVIYSRINPFTPVIINNKTSPHPHIGFNKTRFIPYTNLLLKDSAIVTINQHQKIIFAGLSLLVILMIIKSWHGFLVGFVSIITVLYFADLLFNLFLIIRSLRNKPAIKIRKDETIVQRDWPKYTIICPLYKEHTILSQFIKSVTRLDYPKNKLQVILALEEDDMQTLAVLQKITLPSYIKPYIIPHSLPKTKPKACNYALQQAKGEYVVIYDAEDIPEPLQLKKAVIAFEKYSEENIVCLQAKLNFYNPSQNLLTKMFTLEYSLWFELILTGLHSINAPIPLGGTSNHFKRKYLSLLQGWDPFNVTEDCDLGIRLFKYGFKTKILDSITNEEANSDFFGWFRQRSRWIKGYIQTYLVHMRYPHEFITDWNNPHLFTFQLTVGGKVLSMWINPVLWTMTVCYFAFRPFVGEFIESLYLTPIFYIGVFSLIIGNFFYLYNYMIAAANKKRWGFVKYAFLIPAYWLMMSISSWIALNQLIFKPHFWEKTRHGLHIDRYKSSFNFAFFPKAAKT